MLRGITAEQFMDWKFYAELEPFDEIRQDYRTAWIVKALWDIARDRKAHPEPFPVEQFLLRFGEDSGAPPVRHRQTWQEKKAIAMAIVAAYSQPRNRGRRAVA
jgi:hypothetical protein